MEHVIVEDHARQLVGIRIRTSMAENRTGELWKAFKSQIRHLDLGPFNEYFSVQQFDPDQRMDQFTPHTLYDKWAAIQVEHLDHVPAGLEPLHLPGGLYAVFTHRGTAAAALQSIRSIFTSWLPDSGYLVDQRPHFEIMPEHYRPDDPDAEESFWIPVTSKISTI